MVTLDDVDIRFLEGPMVVVVVVVLKRGETASSKSQASGSDGRSTRGWNCDDGEVETHVGMQGVWAMLSGDHWE